MSTVQAVQVCVYAMGGPRSSLRPGETRNRRPCPQTSAVGTFGEPLVQAHRWVVAPPAIPEVVREAWTERPPGRS